MESISCAPILIVRSYELIVRRAGLTKYVTYRKRSSFDLARTYILNGTKALWLVTNSKVIMTGL